MAFLKFGLLALSYYLLIIIISLHFSANFVNALNVDLQTFGTSIQVSKECSRKCESQFCSVPPLLKYGKYCGVLYSGCPGEKPCDGLDACCMKHDACVQSKGDDYISEECSNKLISCMESFKACGAHTFKGSTCQANDVIEVIKVVMEAALLAARVFHKP